MDGCRRRFTRVNFQQEVQLSFEGKIYEHQVINNLSLGGLYVEGQFQQHLGDLCTIELRQPGMKTVDFRAKGTVVRIDSQGIAVEFVTMEYDSFLFLQTTLIYQADDPVALSTEFQQNLSYVVEEDTNCSPFDHFP
jgi:hypothetical protein